MKKRMKRLLVLLMTAALMVSMLSAGALAEEETAASEETVSEEAAEAEADTAISDTEATASASEAAAEETEETSEADDAEEAAEEASDAEEAAAAAVAEEAEAADEAQADSTAATTTYTVTAGSTTYEYSSDYIVVDETAKTITVSQSGTTAGYEIQAAINYIATLDTDSADSQSGAEDNWTITVSAGTYERFTVKQYLDHLTIKAADGAEVVISVFDNSTHPVGVSNTYPENQGVNIQDADYVTLDGLTFKASEKFNEEDNYYLAAVGTWNNNAGNSSNYITIQNCTFKGSGSDYCNGSHYGFFVSYATNWAVTNCSFDDFYAGICWMVDNKVVDNIEISNNTFTNCERAVDGYYGGGYSASKNTDLGTFKFINNTVTGTEDLNCKVLISDDLAGNDNDGTGNVTISGNTLSNAAFLLFDLNLMNDVLADNIFGDNSYINVASEAASTLNVTVACESDDGQKGYWELSAENPIQIADGYYTLTDDEVALIRSAVQEANESGSHTLTLDFSSLYGDDASSFWKVVTYLKYGVYWVGTSNDTTDPTVDKAVDATEVSAGDTVTFTLTATLPDYLTIYDGDGGLEGATERGSYIITFHDVMDSVFASNDDIVVTIGDTVIGSDYYTVTTGAEDGCTFELTMDLIALYDAGLITDAQIDACAAITVTYTATVADGTAAGSYDNTVSLTYEYWTTDEKTVTVTVEEPEEETDTEDDDAGDTDDTDDTDDADDTEDIEEVDASDTGDPGVMLWTLILGAALCCIVIGKQKIVE